MKKYLFILAICFAMVTLRCNAKELLFMKDPIGDDKGPGYYQYPQDKRIPRGTFDIKSFKVTEEKDIFKFEIRMRNYIMQEWPDTHKSEYQGFVANLWDIYIDIDGIPNSGYKYALPGRDLNFADNMGWEKMILVSPISELALEEILNDKVDELEFQDQVPDIVFPEYVKIQRDTIILRIAKSKLPRLSERSGFQVFAMGYRNIVSPNRLLNRDVKGFPTFEDFGGGSDNYGDPAVMDIIMPKDCDQFEFLKKFKAQPFRGSIEYAEVPFVYSGGNRKSPALLAQEKKPMDGAQKELVSAPIQVSVDAEIKKNESVSKSANSSKPIMQFSAEKNFVPLKNNARNKMSEKDKNTELKIKYIPLNKTDEKKFEPLKQSDLNSLNSAPPNTGFVPLNKK